MENITSIFGAPIPMIWLHAAAQILIALNRPYIPEINLRDIFRLITRIHKSFLIRCPITLKLIYSGKPLASKVATGWLPLLLHILNS
jgi:hypothetical protein